MSKKLILIQFLSQLIYQIVPKLPKREKIGGSNGLTLFIKILKASAK
jgi:hypothetical protein